MKLNKLNAKEIAEKLGIFYDEKLHSIIDKGIQKLWKNGKL